MLFRLKTKNNNGFTLIELLVVISIISLLSSVVLASLSSAKEKARVATAQMQSRQIIQAIIIAQGEQGKPLLSFAPDSNAMHCNSNCSTGLCVLDKANTPACLAVLNTILTEIEGATNGIVKGLSNIKSDPWGYPYFFDANQGEGGAVNCANPDTFSISAPGHTVPNLPTIPLSPSCP